MTGDVESDWMRWRDTPPHASSIPVEVVCDRWDCTRLWRTSIFLPDDALSLVWRPCGKDLLRLAMEGGIYGPNGEALHGSPTLVVDAADPNGPWSQQFVICPAQWPDCGPVTRLWLAPPCGELVEVPADVLGDLVAVVDGGDPIILRGLDGDHLRALAEQVVGMTGGFRA